MTTSKSLPGRPSLESLRKQAKKLARESGVGTREAQLALAREYGFAGWQELLAEVHRRLGQGVEWAASHAHRAIHDNDVDALWRLLTEYPALLSWRSETHSGGLLGMATSSFGDSGDPERERQFTRAACAEILLDAGAVVFSGVCDGLVESRTKGLLQLFERKGVLPRALKFRVALGDMDAVRACIDAGDYDLASVSDALMCACHFEYESIASFLLDRLIALDSELGQRVDSGPGRAAFVKSLIEERATLAFIPATPKDPWQAFLMQRVVRAIHDDDLTIFIRGLQEEPWMLGDSYLGFQVGLIERAILRDRGTFIAALLDIDPALLRHRPPPKSQALEMAFTYAKKHLLPMLTRIWPVPDDLPHAAGMGDLDRVTKWFDADGKPALGDLANHFPCNDPYNRSNLQWGGPRAQQALDTALAWAVVNCHFDVADFLLAHGADINTRWSSHEPASILHELVFHDNYESMRFLIDRGIDMTIKDYRWGGTAAGWAYYAMKDEKMTQWLADAEKQRKNRGEGNPQ